MRHVQDNAEEAVRRVITALEDGSYEYRLDPSNGGAALKVAIRVDRAGREATIDFTGTAPQQPNNFNAPKAVCMAAVLYVFRTLVDRDILLNRLLKAAPRDRARRLHSEPAHPAAVVAGNVETSQCVTQALYETLGLISESQGSMNNFTFGNADTNTMRRLRAVRRPAWSRTPKAGS